MSDETATAAVPATHGAWTPDGEMPPAPPPPVGAVSDRTGIAVQKEDRRAADRRGTAPQHQRLAVGGCEAPLLHAPQAKRIRSRVAARGEILHVALQKIKPRKPRRIEQPEGHEGQFHEGQHAGAFRRRHPWGGALMSQWFCLSRLR